MGLSHKSHGKRSDKETQSPMLKIFKDMMQKDKRDPEKANLLKEKHHERKRKHYSGSRSKSGRTASSSSDHHKNEPYKRTQPETRTAEFDGCSSKHSLPFQNEKRESWWFCDDTDAKKSNDDTCSCVSCALKKLISTDYACIACVTILLLISIGIAVMLVYKSVPCNANADERLDNGMIMNQKMESERLKRKIENLGKWSYGPKKHWRDIFRKRDDPDFGGLNFQRNNDVSLVESETELSKILDSDKLNDIQHSDRLREFYKKLVQTDAAIRNLRKSLNYNAYASTSNLDLNNNYGLNNNFDLYNNHEINSNIDFNSKVNPGTKLDIERLKRSIKFHPGRLFHFKRREPATKSKINNGKLITQSTINMTSNKKPNDNDIKTFRNKRFGNFTEEGLIIEKNKVMIQYKPSRIVPKCSHAPKDSKSHEKDLAHPFYKNTQRLDELLDQFIDKKLPDLFADRLELGVLFDKKKKCKHPTNAEVIVVKDDDMVKDYEQNPKTDDSQKDTDTKDYLNQRPVENQNNNDIAGNTGKPSEKEEQTTTKAFAIESEPNKIISKDVKHSANVFENDFFEDSDGVDKTIAVSTTGGYEILLSISTSVNPSIKRTTTKMTTPIRPNLRKLLQINMNAEDGVAYDDLKEVLADYKEDQDDNEKEIDRKKRNDDALYDTQVKAAETKHTQQEVHNPNWKGPMPLYPDELTQMTIKSQTPNNKVEIPVHNRDTAPETDDAEPSKTDVEYVEDYLDNGYERLVQLAQAYSDYGVLNEKKDPVSDKKQTDINHKLEDRKVGVSMKSLKRSFKRGLKNNHLFEKMKQGREPSEGIRIELQPNPKDSSRPADDTGFKFKEMFGKHVKIMHPQDSDLKYASLKEMSTHMHVGDISLPITAKINANKGFDPNNNVVFKKRTLKAESVSLSNVTVLTDEELANTEISNSFKINSVTNRAKTYNRDTSISADKEPTSETTDSKDPELADNRPLEVDKVTLNNFASSKKTKRTHTQHSFTENFELSKADTSDFNEKESQSSLSSFFMGLSKLFSSFDRMDAGARNQSKVIPRNKNKKFKKHNKEEDSESQLAYPMYDSDMIESIGHRSRVLLSVEIANNTEKLEHLQTEHERNPIAKLATSTEPMNKANSTRSVHKTTETVENKNTVANNSSSRVVKRQAIDDSNLIFWNDLYDEEYGINADPIENNIRDKHSVEKSDILKRSNTWIQDKVKKITEKFYSGSTKKVTKEKVAKDGSKPVKRNIKYNSFVENSNGKIDFGALTVRMKEVCKDTVKAIQDTKHVEVRDDNKENQAATTLMQQLVRLMTDLVDFQVQERTCRRLPPDLQNFLEWLTSSKEDENDSTHYRANTEADQFGSDLNNKLDKTTEHDLLQPTAQDNTDSKTDCLGTLQAVQSLIKEFEEMPEDDKSVMTGIKSYLQNQMQFLQSQLSLTDNKLYFDPSTRYRRDIIKGLGHTVSDTIDETAHELEKQYKNLKDIYHKIKVKIIAPASKEIAKTTEEMSKAVTDMAHKLANPEVKPEKPPKGQQKHEKAPNTGDKTKAETKKEKNHKIRKHKHRSLGKFCLKKRGNVKNKDNENYAVNKGLFGMNTDQAFSDKDEKGVKNIYFKAIEEVEKTPKSKSGHKRESDTFDKTDIFRINDYVGEEDN